MKNSFRYFKYIFLIIISVLTVSIFVVMMSLKNTSNPSPSSHHSSSMTKKDATPSFRSFSQQLPSRSNESSKNQSHVTHLISQKLDFAFSIFNQLQIKKDDSINYGQLDSTTQDELNSSFNNRTSFTTLSNLINISHMHPSKKLRKQLKSTGVLPKISYKILSLSTKITNDNSNSYTCINDLTYTATHYDSKKIKIYFEVDKTTNQILTTSSTFITD